MEFTITLKPLGPDLGELAHGVGDLRAGAAVGVALDSQMSTA